MLLMWGVKEKVLEGDNEGRRTWTAHSPVSSVAWKDQAAPPHQLLALTVGCRSGFSTGVMFVRTASAASSAFWADVATVAQINAQVNGHATCRLGLDFGVRDPRVHSCCGAVLPQLYAGLR